jgi:hypothetical protein
MTTDTIGMVADADPFRATTCGSLMGKEVGR